MFPPTEWQRLDILRAGTDAERREAFDELFRRYRLPVLGFLQRRGRPREHAEDLVQDFFTYCLTERVFDQADPSRGRFRNLMLTALQRYGANQERHAAAQARRPEGGLVSTDTSGPDGTPLDHRAGGATAETAFERAWARALLDRVLVRVRDELSGSGRSTHYDILLSSVVKPVLDGALAPARDALAREHGLTEKEVSNRLVTAKRAYQRLLRDEIRAYAKSDDEVEQEIAELFRAFSTGD